MRHKMTVLCDLQVTYSIKQTDSDSRKFKIDEHSGLITSLETFDRERKKEYYITVIAADGAKSDRPNHQPIGTPNRGK